jgi:hypothetical protein
MGYYEGEIGSLCGNNNNNGWNDWSWIIGLAVVGGIFGNGGFGFGNGGNRGACATQADLSAGFANSEIMSDLNDILLGQATMQNFINQGFSGLNSTINTGFAGVNNAICTLGYQNAQLINSLSRELGDCCCATQRAIDSVKLENERNTCSIINASNANTRAILDFLTTEKISALQAENSGLKAQISNDMQSNYIISKLSPCPTPAYVVPNPNCCYNICGCASVQ